MYILCRIEEEQKLPRRLEQISKPASNTRAVERLVNQKGVLHIDYRRNGVGVS